MVIVAPTDAREDARARALLDSCVAGEEPGERRSLPRRAPVDAQRRWPGVSAAARTADGRRGRRARRERRLDDALHDALGAWVDRHYRDRLVPADLADPVARPREMTALDELTQLLALGSIYDYQSPADLDRGPDPP